uniref:Uncharacterized protein n=1 Tax=Siphoviridae sp. ctBLh2 TaxID=2827803 RepID=A0A8S5S3S3_9CAUD|nr:MAG TPA: hypothetical protein [Siphoviridae sp. ctBLh2]
MTGAASSAAVFFRRPGRRPRAESGAWRLHGGLGNPPGKGDATKNRRFSSREPPVFVCRDRSIIRPCRPNREPP